MVNALLGAAGLVSWFLILQRWKRGLILLILYLPIGGAIILRSGNAPVAILAKDLLFVLPLYVAFLLSGVPFRTVRLPPGLALPLIALIVIVVLQMANSGDAGLAVALVGAKVWLLYIPLLPVTLAALGSERELTAMLRSMVVLVPLPCLVGLLQYVGSSTLGHQATITAFYGDAAAGATQGFAAFDYGGALYRLPSTFVSVSHYFGYLEHSLVPLYAVLRGDPSRRWRRYSGFVTVLVVVAAFLSGARSAFVFMPVFLVLMLVLDRVLAGALTWVVVTPSLFLLALGLAGIDPVTLFTQVGLLTQLNAKGLAFTSIVDAMTRYPFGTGTGMNTNAARHVAADPTQLVGFESQYAKTVTELGIIGLVALLAVLLAMAAISWRARRAAAGTRWESTTAALAAYFLILPVHALKGWPLDWEPANVYYWMFGAICLVIPKLTAAAPVRTVTLRDLWEERRQAHRLARDSGPWPAGARPNVPIRLASVAATPPLRGGNRRLRP
jgi:hypothetical protein